MFLSRCNFFSLKYDSIGLRQQSLSLTSQLEEERERYQILETRLRSNESSSRASQLASEDERLRNDETTRMLQSQVVKLEEKLKSIGGNDCGENPNSPGDIQSLKDKKIDDLEIQVKTLSTQLLKKQGKLNEKKCREIYLLVSCFLFLILFVIKVLSRICKRSDLHLNLAYLMLKIGVPELRRHFSSYKIQKMSMGIITNLPTAL